MMTLDISLLTTIFYSFEWLLRLIAVFVVPRNRKPTSGAAWLMVIFLLPIPGWLIFLLIGHYKLPKVRLDVQHSVNQAIESYLTRVQRRDSTAAQVIDVTVDPKYQSLATLSTALSQLPVFSGNSITPIASYDTSIDTIVADIDAAVHTVYIEYYAITLDGTTKELFDALAAAVKRGVTVRVLYDQLGSYRYRGFRAMKKRLRNDGIAWHAMLPLRPPGRGYIRPDLRNHRKLVVIDHEIGYTGSQNLIDRGYHRRDDIVYDEMVTRLTGPIVVQLSAVFISDWISETNEPPEDSSPNFDQYEVNASNRALLQVLPSGPGYEDENNLKVFTHALHLARQSVTIVTPYLVPTESLLTAIISAARRGVTITIINSQAMDQWLVGHAQRSYYTQLLEAGIMIYLYKKPMLLHAKFMVVDDEITLSGSSNMDVRSFELDHELTLIAYDKDFSSVMKKHADGYVRRSRRIKLEDWQKRRPIRQLMDNLARLTSPLQ